MAFENVYRGIDFQAPNRAGRADQQMLMQAIGQGIGAYERGEERDIQKMQLEQKAQAAQAKAAGNFEQIAMEELNRINLGGQPTPQGQAALKVMGQTSKPTVGLDEYGNRTVTPSPWQSMMGGQTESQGQPSPVPSVTPPMEMGQFDQIMPSVDRVTPSRPDFTVTGAMADSPAAEKIEQGVAADIFKEEIRDQRNQQNLQKYGDAQLIAANFSNRMKVSDDLIKELPPTAKEARTGWLGRMAQVLDVLPLGEFGTATGEAILQSNVEPEQQQYLNAAINWVTANLRKESGAAIPPSELASEYKKYFPMAGDSGALIEQKSKLRKEAQKGMIGQSAGSYQLMFGKKAQAQNGSSAVSWQEYFK